MRLPPALGLLLAAAGRAHAQILLNDLSFGFGARIAPVGETKVPNFSLQGGPTLPEILSDKLILTPPAPGGYRGAVWSEKKLDYTNWIVDVEFRVSGPERATGNLNIWLVRDGDVEVRSASIYTVGKFDGLALVVDQVGGSGMIRGFLNDGTNEYKSMSVDGMAFGNCYQQYRNLGRPMQIKMRQTDDGLKVEVDGRTCFESDKISIPSGYQLGVTAATSDNPDSFEVFKLVAMTEDVDAHRKTRNEAQSRRQALDDQQRREQEQMKEAEDPPKQASDAQGGGDGDDLPDADPETIVSSKAQFADLHNRLQGVNHHISSVYRSHHDFTRVTEQRHAELSGQIDDLKKFLQLRMDKLDTLDQRISGLEREVKDLRGELSRKIKDSEMAVKGHVGDQHQNLAETVKAHAAPGHGRLIFVIIVGQLLLVGGYVVYKRRKSTPKKYL